jgi:PQQ-like domain
MMHHMRPLRPRTFAGLLVACALAGCSGSGSSNRDETYHPSVPTSSTPSTSPGRVTTPAETTPAEPSPATAPERGTDLATLDGSDPVDVVGGPQGFSVVVTVTDVASSSVTTYDPAGNELTTIGDGDLDGSCGADDVVVPGRGRLIIAKLGHHTPAQGIKPAHSSIELKAFDANTGQMVWSVKNPRGGGSCSEGDFGATSDGRYGLWAPRGPHPLVVNLKTGEGRVDDKAIVTVGPYVADLKSSNVDQPSATDYTITDAGSGDRLGSIHNIHLDGEPVAVPRSLVPDHGGGPPPAGLSSDGKVLFAFDQDPPLVRGNSDRLLALSLPSGKLVWKTPGTFQPYIYGNGHHEELIGLDERLRAVDDHTGAERWHIHDGQVCAVTDSEMLLAVHHQLAVIDMGTGKQLDYDDSDSVCPDHILDGGVSWSGSDDGQVTVTQLLNP